MFHITLRLKKSLLLLLGISILCGLMLLGWYLWLQWGMLIVNNYDPQYCF
ncbi:hypothetical protein BegalDRAFT_1081 [Beggiatoa alba B18LD]|uniref:Uncharacterized protein n=1 Tax=Beggiatoa alba B18LD TaxID=395493 RepID=I3CEE1_9GAMM|nr:hypothetical protein [Beggiatoa alba]EIJ41984.1 hypothetical protein BegalDRAFT_1081 [Beggiatoa alba B18LD]